MRPAVCAASQNGESSADKADGDPSDAELLRSFSTGRHEAAFETLVRRHGPMVQGVCRRILGDVHDAEDAFQAVFLVLVRKSASIRRPELLANWLYGVACRIARKARIGAIRKENRERRAAQMPTQEQLLDHEWTELKAVLDEELSHLPEKYRAPLVLCYLCGQTNAAAAEQLGWPSGSMSERLSRARELLRKRLNRRGLTLSAGLLALLLSQMQASAGVSTLLIQSTVKVGLSFAGKTSAAETASSAVLELAGDAPLLSPVRTLKLFSVALLMALAIATTWPHVQQFSDRSLGYLSDAFGWNQGSSVFGAIRSTNGAAVIQQPGCAGHAGSCCSSAKDSSPKDSSAKE